MTWTHIKANRPYMLIEQWVFRTRDNIPACSLKRGDHPGDWEASILNHNGISTVPHAFVAKTLDEAQQKCRKRMEAMGWKK